MPPCCSRVLKRSIARLHGGRNAEPRDVLAATQKRNDMAAGLSARRFCKIKWKPRVAVAEAASRGRGHDRNASGVPLANVSRTQTRSNCNKIKKEIPKLTKCYSPNNLCSRGRTIAEPTKADDLQARRLEPDPKKKCPSSCPSRPRAGQNKRTRRPGKCSLPRPNKQLCSPAVLVFAPLQIANKDAPTESFGRGNKTSENKQSKTGNL